MPPTETERPAKRSGGERRSRRRRHGTAEDLRHSVLRVKAALRNRPTQVLRAAITRALSEPRRRALADAGCSEGSPGARSGRILQIPFGVARRVVALFRKLT